MDFVHINGRFMPIPLHQIREMFATWVAWTHLAPVARLANVAKTGYKFLRGR
jgi:hypothetical protein